MKQILNRIFVLTGAIFLAANGFGQFLFKGPGIAPGATLTVGSNAPELKVEWIRGKKVDSLTKGICIVEFWATNCTFCRECVPFLSRIAKSNPDINVIGVSIWEDNSDARVLAYSEKMGSKMDYSVAYGGNREGMSKTWMIPAGLSAIPTSMIVKDGIIFWIGHPMDIPPVLLEVKSGELDITSAIVEHKLAQKGTSSRIESYSVFREGLALLKAGKTEEIQTRLTELDSLGRFGAQRAKVLRLKLSENQGENSFTKLLGEFRLSGQLADAVALAEFAGISEKSNGLKAVDVALVLLKGKENSKIGFSALQFVGKFFTTGKGKAGSNFNSKRANLVLDQLEKALPNSEFKDSIFMIESIAEMRSKARL